MKLKSNLTVPTLVILSILLLLLLLFLTGNKLVKKDHVIETIKKINISEYVKKDEIIQKKLKENYIPEEVFDEIDEKKLERLIEKSVNALYQGEKKIIEAQEISSLLEESVQIYEEKYKIDAGDYLTKEIADFSQRLAQTWNRQEFLSSFQTVTKFLEQPMVLIIFIIIISSLTAIVFYLEGKQAFFWIGILFLLTSFVFYYVDSNWKLFFLAQNEFSSIWEIDMGLLGLDSYYLMFFLLGLSLVVTGIIFKMKKWYRKLRCLLYDQKYGRYQ